jgi:hypothetical protein
VEHARKYDEPGKFVTILAYERHGTAASAVAATGLIFSTTLTDVTDALFVITVLASTSWPTATITLPLSFRCNSARRTAVCRSLFRERAGKPRGRTSLAQKQASEWLSTVDYAVVKTR